MQRPRKKETSDFYISTLSSSSWIAVATTIFGLLLFMWTMFYFCPDPSKNKSIKYLGECLLFVSRSVTNRGR